MDEKKSNGYGQTRYLGQFPSCDFLLNECDGREKSLVKRNKKNKFLAKKNCINKVKSYSSLQRYIIENLVLILDDER